MADSRSDNANRSTSSESNACRVDLSLVLKFEEEQYLGGNGEVNECLIDREALDAAEAAREGTFDVEISLIDGVQE